MKKLFNKIFWPKWELKEVIMGKWFIDNYDILTGYFLYESEKSCTYEIMYSEPRNEWKINMGGRKPKSHPIYKYAVERLNQLRNGI